ncbi:MAG: tryptophan--tRNA ligase [Lachnospirales bacterium]
MEKKNLLSGIKPTGDLTLGNYIGAINSWQKMIEEYNCYFPVVNLHAITERQDPQNLRKRTLDVLATYIASGIDPKTCTLFIQSRVPQHAELCWLLSCNTYMGELNRMTQFKDKAAKADKNTNIGFGLFSYPVLMAADILLYDVEVVPVGVDQKQHVELARDIAIRFNNHYGDTFVVPEPVISKTGAKIMDLTDPTKKMSKSDQDSSVSQNSYILVIDEPDIITKKIKKAVTDDKGIVQYNDEQLGVKNLLHIYTSLTNTSIESALSHFEGANYGKFKGEVAEAIIETLKPVQAKRLDLLNNLDYLESIYKIGEVKAIETASIVLEKAKKQIGIL